jgi:polyisoprenoid-binding protein YceI
MRTVWTVLAVLSLGRMQAAPPAWAQAVRAVPGGTLAQGTLSFDGRASAGDFIGTTSTVTGEMSGGDGLEAVRGWVEAPVATLKTGNGRRDRDLNKSMESDKYPTMRFDLDGVATGGAGDSVPVTLKGRLTLHGVQREVELPGSVVFGGGDVRVRSEFPLNLKDYKIGGLTKLMGMLRMYEDIKVHVDLTFHPAQ